MTFPVYELSDDRFTGLFGPRRGADDPDAPLDSTPVAGPDTDAADANGRLVASDVTLRVLVYGGLDYVKEWVVFRALQELWERHDERLVVIDAGAKRGAEAAAATWAVTWHRAGNGVDHEPLALRRRERTRITALRADIAQTNARLLNEARPHVVLAFSSASERTRNMVDQAKAAGIPVRYPDRHPHP